MIVERGRRGVGLAVGRERQRQRLLGRGLADRAGDRDDLRLTRARAAPARSRRAASTSSTTSNRARRRHIARVDAARHHRERGARLERGRDEIMAVVDSPLMAKYASPGRSVRLSIEMPVMAAGSAPDACRRVAAAIASSSIRAPSSRRLGRKRRRDRLVIAERHDFVADDLAGLVALAGDQQDVAGSSPATARRIASARSPISPAPGAAAIMAARIAAGSSLRGLSSVTMTRSAISAAIAPISGRLPASRSPPAPNTTTSRPPHRGAAPRAPSPAHRACGRSRQRSARRLVRRRVRAGPWRRSALRARRTRPRGRRRRNRLPGRDQRVLDLEARRPAAAAPDRSCRHARS